MVESSSPTVVVDENTELGVSVLGIVAAVAAAYYTGRTGHWWPLLAITFGLVFVVLFVASE